MSFRQSSRLKQPTTTRRHAPLRLDGMYEWVAPCGQNFASLHLGGQKIRDKNLAQTIARTRRLHVVGVCLSVCLFRAISFFFLRWYITVYNFISCCSMRFLQLGCASSRFLCWYITVYNSISSCSILLASLFCCLWYMCLFTVALFAFNAYLSAMFRYSLLPSTCSISFGVALVAHIRLRSRCSFYNSFFTVWNYSILSSCCCAFDGSVQ